MRAHCIAWLSVAAVTLAGTVAAEPPEYVPGMRCDQVGGFAAAVVREKGMGDSMREQIVEMRQSIPEYHGAQERLERIIRAIYTDPKLRAASPDAVGKAYERTCDVVSQ